jgi:DNA-binding PadR family transcriptional regulator
VSISLYVLGLLRRFGPLHGYEIRKRIEEQLADFAQIKLPTVYYHLQRLEQGGLLRGTRQPGEGRPDRTTYAVTRAGERAFEDELRQALGAGYRPAFALDAALFFSDALPGPALAEALRAHAAAQEQALAALAAHRGPRLAALAPAARRPAALLFDHHERHHRAELDWALAALESLAPGRPGRGKGEDR